MAPYQSISYPFRFVYHLLLKTCLEVSLKKYTEEGGLDFTFPTELFNSVKTTCEDSRPLTAVLKALDGIQVVQIYCICKESMP